MINLDCVNARDVLAHLKTLGYHDITAQQLKEFLHDLKKLIKYEQKHVFQNSTETKSEKVHSSECDCSRPEYYDNSDTLSSNNSSQDTSYSSCPTSATYSRNYSKNSATNKHSLKTSTEFDLAQTAHTSFIRPWNLQAGKDISNRGKKNLDPVRLYHQYKKLWKSQHIPGESKHLELRWNIRNRMLGQEPHPREAFKCVLSYLMADKFIIFTSAGLRNIFCSYSVSKIAKETLAASTIMELKRQFNH